jgi:glyoxylase-like metal-dependent hydrolase (beta-lactamase superfamily II)
MLQYTTVPVTPFQQNCSIVWCDEAKRAAIIDPGGDLDTLLAVVKKTGADIEQIWLTHAHINHAHLIASITQRLWPYGNDTVFIPGHGPESTFGQERQSNPYVCGT